jgi:hypothetical protein
MRNTQLTTASILLGLCAVATCAAPTSDPVEARHHHFPDASVQIVVDAATTSPPPAGTVSCYTEGAPATTCTLPEHCCFTNYSAQHDGACETSACAYGTISCDGPEDCGTGEHCCAHAINVACQASACGAPPVDNELCHPGGAACSNGGSCVTALGNANDLPRTLDVCR